MNKIERIKTEFSYYLDDETGYIRIDEENGIETVEDVIIHVEKMFDVELDFKYIGGFDSPGCEINCYAWAGIIDGELYFDGFEEYVS